jgi:hypothetical protein
MSAGISHREYSEVQRRSITLDLRLRYIDSVIGSSIAIRRSSRHTVFGSFIEFIARRRIPVDVEPRLQRQIMNELPLSSSVAFAETEFSLANR